jgi:hypothetical protein
LTSKDIADGRLYALEDAETYRSFAIMVYDYWYGAMVKISCEFAGAWVYDSLQKVSQGGREIWKAEPSSFTYDQGIGVGAALALAAIAAQAKCSGSFAGVTNAWSTCPP